MWFSSLTSCCLVVRQSPNGVLDQVQFLLTRCLILICFQSIYFISFHVPLFPIHRRNVCVHCVLCKHCLTKSISFGTVFIPISHYIRYTCIIPGSNPFCLQNTFILHGRDLARCWTHYSVWSMLTWQHDSVAADFSVSNLLKGTLLTVETVWVHWTHRYV